MGSQRVGHNLATCPGYYKQCCDEHWGTRVSFNLDTGGDVCRGDMVLSREESAWQQLGEWGMEQLLL